MKSRSENKRARVAVPDAGTHPIGDVLVRNQLLAALPRDAFANLLRHLETMVVALDAPLPGNDGSMELVYFPETAILSLETPREVGVARRTGTIGNEGMTGLPVFLNGDASPLQTFAAVPGVVRRMEAQAFRQLASVPGPLHQVMLGYAQWSLTHIAQTAACAAAHRLEPRCAGLLLLTSRRVGASEFALADESLSIMLDVRRAGVTAAMRTLHDRRFIRSIGDRIQILDELALERESCDCDDELRREYARLLPAVA